MITRFVQIKCWRLHNTHAYHTQVQPYAGNRQSSVSLPLRPVIVFITGHDFQGQDACKHIFPVIFFIPDDAGNLGGARLMREELVVVTVEYRSVVDSRYLLEKVSFMSSIPGPASSGFSLTRPSLCPVTWAWLTWAWPWTGCSRPLPSLEVTPTLWRWPGGARAPWWPTSCPSTLGHRVSERKWSGGIIML